MRMVAVISGQNSLTLRLNLEKAMKNRIFPLLAAVILFSFAACTTQEGNNLTSAAASTVDALAAHIDSTVKPGDDFFLYANGTWFNENPIKPAERTAGLWRMIGDTIQAQVLDICKKSADAKAAIGRDRKSTGLNSSHGGISRMPSSA